MRETVILQLLDAAATQARWWRLAPGGATPTLTAVDQSVQQGSVADALASCGGRRVIVLVPAEQVLLTQVQLAVRQQAKLMQAVPYALEEQLAEDVQHLHFALGARQADGSIPVAVVAREQMTCWLAVFAESGVTPDLFLVDALTLPLHSNGPTLYLDDDGRCLIRSGPAQGIATELDLLPHLSERLPGGADAAWTVLQTAQAASPPDEFTVAAREPVSEAHQAFTALSDAGRLNLLQGSYAPRHAGDQWLRAARLPAGLAASWVLLATLGLALANVQLGAEKAALDEQAMGHFNAAFPQITRIVDMRVQAQQGLERLRGGGASKGFLHLLGQSTPALDAVDALQLDGIQYRDDALYLSLSGDDLQALEKLRAEFAKNSAVGLDVQSAQAGSDGVQIRLKVDAR